MEEMDFELSLHRMGEDIKYDGKEVELSIEHL